MAARRLSSGQETRRPEAWPMAPPSPRKRLGLLIPVGAACALAALLMVPSLRERRRAERSAAISTCMARLDEIGMAIGMYRADHTGRLPESLDQLVPEYLAGLPVCPYASSGTDKYRYEPPGVGEAPSAPLVTCERHPGVTIYLTRDLRVKLQGSGSVRGDGREALYEQGKRSTELATFWRSSCRRPPIA